MGNFFPFRDINVHASAAHYAFTSPSSPSSQTLVVERPSGDLRLNDGPLLGTKRVSSIAGILGIIGLGLGILPQFSFSGSLMAPRQVHHNDHQSPAYGAIKGAYGLQDNSY